MANYLVVGASSGIGASLAHLLAQSGHQVYGTYFNNQPADTVPGIQYQYLNVLDEILPLDFLPDSLAGVVYCPGSIHLLPFKRIKPEALASDFALHVTGAVKVLQALESKLRNSDNAAILLFSTVAVQTGIPYHAQVSSVKGALEGLTKALAAEFAPQIRVNCIAPSLTDTPLAAPFLNTEAKREANNQRQPLKRTGTANDIAQTAAFLLSENASWLTGQVIHADGGLGALKI